MFELTTRKAFRTFSMATVLVLSGCLGTSPMNYWYKSGATNDALRRDWAGCEMLAAGVPEQQTQQLPKQYYGTTQVYGNTATTTVYSQQNTLQPMADIVASAGTARRKAGFLNNCMISKGWNGYKEKKDWEEAIRRGY